MAILAYFDLVELELEAEELAEDGRKGGEDDHLGDIVDPGVNAKAAYLEGTFDFLKEPV